MRPHLDLLRREKDVRRLYLAQLVALGGHWSAIVPLLVLLPALTGGRVFSADHTLASLVIAGSQVVLGLLSDHVGARLLLAASGAVVPACAAVWWLSTRPLRTVSPDRMEV